MLREKIIELVTSLVAIDSSNAFLIPGSPGERGAQEFMAHFLERHGIDAALEPAGGRHANLVASLKGRGGGRNLTLYAHADTVGYELWSDRALGAKIDRDGDRMVGLGAADDKGHCAAAMLAVIELASGGGLEGDVNIAIVADEEGESAGAMNYVKSHVPEAVLVLEAAPIEQINITHQGFGWLDIVVKGRAAHGSVPGAGRDAISQMAEILVRLEKLRREAYAPAAHPLNGEIVFHTGTITGGTDYGTYPEHCRLGVEIGTQPGETIQNRIDEIGKIFVDVAKIYPDLDARVETKIARNPFEAREHGEIYDAYASTLERVTGKKAEATGGNSWGDAQLFQDAGFPTIGVGAMGENLHAPDEWVSIVELEQLVRIITAVAREYCGG